MGLFDSMKRGTVNGRNDDGPGTYWQRIDKVRVIPASETQSKQEFLQITKTNIHVVAADPKGKAVGEQVTQGIFNDPRYNYFDRDLRRLARAIFNMSDAEANKIPEIELQQMVTTNAEKLRGVVLEARVKLTPKKKKPGEFFAEVDYLRSVTKDEIKKTLPPAKLAELYPTGV